MRDPELHIGPNDRLSARIVAGLILGVLALMCAVYAHVGVLWLAVPFIALASWRLWTMWPLLRPGPRSPQSDERSS